MIDSDKERGFPEYTSCARKGELGVNIVNRTVFDEFGYQLNMILQPTTPTSDAGSVQIQMNEESPVSN